MVVEGEMAEEMINKERTMLKNMVGGKLMEPERKNNSRKFTKAMILWFAASYASALVCMPVPPGTSMFSWALFLVLPCGTLAVVLAAAMSRKPATEPTVLVAATTSGQDVASPGCSDMGVNSFGNTPMDLTLGAGFDQTN